MVVEKVKNGNNIQFLLTAVILIATISTGAWAVSSSLGAIGERVRNNEKQVEKLIKFMEVGDRFTKHDGQRLELRIRQLEEWTTNAPPAWFRTMFREFKDEVRSDIRDIKSKMTTVCMDINSLKELNEMKEKEKRKNEHTKGLGGYSTWPNMGGGEVGGDSSGGRMAD